MCRVIFRICLACESADNIIKYRQIDFFRCSNNKMSTEIVKRGIFR